MKTATLVTFAFLVSCSSLLAAQAKSGKSDANSGGGTLTGAASSFWVAPSVGLCDTSGDLKARKLVFALATAPGAAATQPYLVVPQVPSNGLPTLYAGEDLVIEVHGTNQQVAEIPLLNIGVDLQKTDAINAAPVRPSFAPPTKGAAQKVDKSFCMFWPKKLAADTIPKITITAIYAPKGTTDPAKQKTIPLITVCYPQIHNLYRYNVAFGVIVSSLHNPSFSRVQTSLPMGKTPAQFETVKNNGDVSVFPVLVFTAYLFRAMDSESPWHRSDLIPEPSVGFSLASPSDNFIFGGSSEIIRNVQLVYGYHLGRVNQLAPTVVVDPTSSAAPMTQKRFSGGVFAGMTFNIDFIKGLFSGK